MKTALIGIALIVTGLELQAADPDFQRLLAAEPEGVVFEMMTWEDDSWSWALPLLSDYVSQLQQRLPGTDMVLISHGAEMFELARDEAGSSAQVINRLADLSDAGLEIHIDGSYARWKRLGEADFPDYVDLAESADAMLADYIRLGFQHIRLEPADAVD